MQFQNNDSTPGARVELVTTTFVASGEPQGIHDLSRFLENLNNPAIARQIELRNPIVRPLYRAATQLALDAPLLVRRDDIVFANFEGPYYTRGAARPPQVAESPVLLMAPPFQIQGVVETPIGAERTQALRAMAQQFFVVRGADVFDAEGATLGQGEQIVVNGAVVQMMSATRKHIEAAAPAAAARRRARENAIAQDDAAAEEATLAAAAAEKATTRAA